MRHLTVDLAQTIVLLAPLYNVSSHRGRLARFAMQYSVWFVQYGPKTCLHLSSRFFEDFILNQLGWELSTVCCMLHAYAHNPNPKSPQNLGLRYRLGLPFSFSLDL